MPKINRNQAGNGENRRNLRVLLAPLDWGLGHATRCIPVIYELLKKGASVSIAAEGAQEQLLKQEFPDLDFLPLPGYRVRYAKTGQGLLKTLLIQLPRLFRIIRKERHWLKEVVAQYSFDAVISDNRYGLSHSDIPCILLTHQLNIQAPMARWLEHSIQSRIYKHINRFTECWVPDEEMKPGLAGVLSHPLRRPAIPLRYLGPLSRLYKTGVDPIKNHILISISGPEPQRTLFENKIIDQVAHYNGTAVVLRGLPGEMRLIPSSNDIKFYNHLSSAEYGIEMEKAEWVICRSGYSTIMDLINLQKKSILIPTPGQTEQEYLAQHLNSSGMAIIAHQDDFSLNDLLEKARNFNYKLPSIAGDNKLEHAVAGLLASAEK